MAMQTDVLSSHVDVSGLVVNYRTRLKGFIVISGGTAGDIIISNGGSSAAVLLQFNIPSSTISAVFYNLPGEGIVASAGLYVTLPTASKITLIYG
jgi:hypothetical protein